MKRPKNLDIRNKISEFNLKYWEVAENLGITDSTFSRRLRKELPEEEKTKILKVISKLMLENKKEEETSGSNEC